MKSLPTTLIAALVIAGVVMYWIQHQSSEKLRADIAALTDQNDSLKADTDNLSRQLAQATNSQAAGKEQLAELLKLRNEVGQLRHQTNEIGKLREENKQLQAAVVTAQPPPAATDAQEQERQIARQKMGDAKQGVLAFIMFAADNNEQYPTNFTSASRYLNGDHMAQVESNFDLLYQGSTSSLTNPSAVIVIREKQAWQSLSGRWMKTYGFADGHAEIHAEPTGNFDDWESQHMVPPPANQ
ncbi:MAG TPA: hypothetical protein VK815_03815 [Candidatus Acidoferrales bacterium]|jgi:hypothetical protein|nr:hypothetical protein [Candidatus Acidoferrales bacterium]